MIGFFPVAANVTLKKEEGSYLPPKRISLLESMICVCLCLCVYVCLYVRKQAYGVAVKWCELSIAIGADIE